MNPRFLAALSLVLLATGMPSAPRARAAEPAPPQALTLPDARRLAVAQWPAIRAARHATDAQRPLVKGGLLPDDPVLSAQIWQLPLNGVEGSLMPGMSARDRAWNAARGPDMFPLMVMVSQAFPWPGRKLAERDEAAAGVRSREAAQRRVEADVRKAVAYAYAEAVATERLLELLGGSATDLDRMRTWAEGRLSSGLGSTQEVVSLQAERDALEAAMIDARWQQRLAHARLASLAGLESAGGLRVGRGSVMTASLPARQALVDRALQERPELDEARAALAVAAARTRRERAALLPDVTASAAYMLNVGGAGMLLDHGPHEALLGPADAVTVGVSVPVPVFAPWKQGARTRGAALGVRSAEAEVEALTRLAALDVDEALAALEHALAHVALHQATLIPRALEALRLAQAGYAGGTVDAQSVLAAARTVRSHHVERVQNELEYARHLADLERITGLSLLRFGAAEPDADNAPVDITPSTAPNAPGPTTSPAATAPVTP